MAEVVEWVLNVKVLMADKRTAYEYSEWSCSSNNQTVRLVVIYQPPNLSYVHNFLSEFSGHLVDLQATDDHLVIRGDFSIHVDNLLDT